MAVRACVKSTRHKSCGKHLRTKSVMKEGGKEKGCDGIYEICSIKHDLKCRGAPVTSLLESCCSASGDMLGDWYKAFAVYMARREACP